MNGPLVLIWFTSKQICTLFGLETLDLLHPQSKILQIYFVLAFYFTRLILKHLCKFCCVLSFLYPRSVYRDQCNQMLKLKLAQFFISCPISDYRSYCFNTICFKIAQKVIKYFGYFCKKIYCQELSKIAQSGHSDRDSKTLFATNSEIKFYGSTRQQFTKFICARSWTRREAQWPSRWSGWFCTLKSVCPNVYISCPIFDRLTERKFTQYH